MAPSTPHHHFINGPPNPEREQTLYGEPLYSCW